MEKGNQKVLLLAFNGEILCFAHVLLHALDLHARGFEVRVIIEGTATRLVQELEDPGKPFALLYHEVREKDLIESVCQACSAKMGSAGFARAQGLRLDGGMKGHPSLSPWLEKGYHVITF